MHAEIIQNGVTFAGAKRKAGEVLTDDELAQLSPHQLDALDGLIFRVQYDKGEGPQARLEMRIDAIEDLVMKLVDKVETLSKPRRGPGRPPKKKDDE